MNRNQIGLAFLMAVSCVSRAEPKPGEFDEIHFGVPAESSVLAVTVISRGPALWHLWPEEVKIERKGALVYSLKYSDVNTTSLTLLRAARHNLRLSSPCRQEAGTLLLAPKEKISDDKLTTTVYIPLEEKHPERMVLKADVGLKLLKVEAFQPDSTLEKEEPVVVEPWTRALYLRLSYSASYYLKYGPSDFAVVQDPATGTLQVSPQKAGLAALKQFIQEKWISEACAAEMTRQYWGPPSDPLPTHVEKKSIVLVLPLPKDAPRNLSVETNLGITLQSVQALH